MKRSSLLIASAVGGLLAAGLASGAAAQDKAAPAKEKCYGVAKAGQNDCGTASHACAGTAKKDLDADEWKLVPKGSCEKLGGKLTAAADKKSADPAKKT
jgi:uncharacterized membrane protein